jgi:hypothetical protein
MDRYRDLYAAGYDRLGRSPRALGGLTVVAQNGGEVPDIDKLLDELTPFGDTAKIEEIIDRMRRAPDHEALGLQIAGIAAAEPRNGLRLAPVALRIYGGEGGPVTVDQAVAFINQIKPGSVAKFASYLAHESSLDPLPPLEIPSAIDIMDAMGQTERAGPFAEGVFKAVGFGKGDDDGKIARALARAWQQDDQRLTEFAQDRFARPLFTNTAYLADALDLLRRPEFTVDKVHEGNRRSPWLSEAAVIPRIQDAMKVWLDSEYGKKYGKLTPYPGGKLAEAINFFRDDPQGMFNQGVNTNRRDRFYVQTTGYIEEAIRKLSQKMGGSYDEPVMEIVPVYHSYANGDYQRNQVLFAVHAGGQVKYVNLQGSTYETPDAAVRDLERFDSKYARGGWTTTYPEDLHLEEGPAGFKLRNIYRM